MIPVYGKVPKDCLRSCLASLLEKDYYEIPYVDPDLPVDAFWLEYRKAVNELGFEYVLIDAMQIMVYGFKGFTIGMGKTGKGTDHAVVCYDSEQVFNPSPKSIVRDIQQFILLVPMKPWQIDLRVKSKNTYMMENQA